MTDRVPPLSPLDPPRLTMWIDKPHYDRPWPLPGRRVTARTVEFTVEVLLDARDVRPVFDVVRGYMDELTASRWQ